MGTFRKKPVLIEAQQWDGTLDGAHEIIEWADGFGRSDTAANLAGGSLFISTLEGNMHAAPGDWIIRGVHGELYPCKPDIFEATYEPV